MTRGDRELELASRSQRWESACRRSLLEVSVGLLTLLMLASASICAHAFSKQVIITGAGSSAADGTYVYGYMYQGKPSYISGDNFLYWGGDSMRVWYLQDAHVGIGYYVCRSDTPEPPSTGWELWPAPLGSGVLPIPAVEPCSVGDTTPPILTIPSNVTVECDAPLDPSTTGHATATDECDSDPEVTYTDRYGYTGGICHSGYFLRDWKATDLAGNETTGTQTICHGCADYTLTDYTSGWVTSLPATVSISFTFEKFGTSASAILNSYPGLIPYWSSTAPIVSDGHTVNTLTIDLPADAPEGTYIWWQVNVDTSSVPVREMVFYPEEDYPAVRFVVDVTNPHVTAVTASDALITDEDCGPGKTFTLAVDFSEAMDTSIDPAILLTGDVHSTLTASSGSWVDDTRFEVTYSVTDACVDQPGVDVCVDGAKDKAGNPLLAMVPYTRENVFDIDTRNLELSGITTSHASPCCLCYEEEFTVGFDYTTDYPGDVMIFARPYTDGTRTPGYTAHASPRYAAGSGHDDGWFYFTAESGVTTIDEVRLEMVDADSFEVLVQVTVPVDVQWGLCPGDTTSPVLTVPPSLRIDCNSSWHPDSTGWATATDNCDPEPAITYTDHAYRGGDCHSSFIRRSWQATDAAGNIATGTQDICLDWPDAMVTERTIGWITSLPATAYITFTMVGCADEAITSIYRRPDATPRYMSSWGQVVSDGTTPNTLTVNLPADAQNGVYQWDYIYLRMNIDPNPTEATWLSYVFGIDTTSPTNPSIHSETHSPGTCSSNATVAIAASGATDNVSGVDGFEVAWDQTATWVPTQTKTHDETWSGGSFTATADGDWYLHLCTVDVAGNWTEPILLGPFTISTAPPAVVGPLVVEPATLTESSVGTAEFRITVEFDKDMNTSVEPAIAFVGSDLGSTLTPNNGLSGWLNSSTYMAYYDVADTDLTAHSMGLTVDGAEDVCGMVMEQYTEECRFDVDMECPEVEQIEPSSSWIRDEQVGPASFSLRIVYSESIDPGEAPAVAFPVEDPGNVITLNAGQSDWADERTYVAVYDVADSNVHVPDIDVLVSGVRDRADNPQAVCQVADLFTIDTRTWYELDTSAVPPRGGTIRGGGTHAEGAIAPLRAVAASGYRFAEWVAPGDVTGQDNPVDVVMDCDRAATALFIQTFTLETGSSFLEGGTVSGSGTYDVGDVVSVKASPAAGYRFVGWSGDASGVKNPIDVVMDADKDIVAQFVRTFFLAAVASPKEGGTVNGSGTYAVGDVVPVKASPTAGYRFVGWSGDASGSGNSIDVVMDADKDIVAQFARTFTIETAASPEKSGAVSEGGIYDAGDVLSVAAVPAIGYRFVGWSGDASGSSNPIHVVMDTDRSIIAQFVRTYKLEMAVEPVGAGRVTGAGVYDEGTQARMYAAAVGSSYRFSGWTGAVTGTANPAVITMDSDQAVTAHFTRWFFISARSERGTTGGLVTGSGTYEAGAEATLTAIPAEGYQFDHWEGAFSGSDNPATVPVDSNKIVYAHFVRTFTLRAIPNNAYYGTIEGGGVYVEGTTATLSATPQPGYAFVGWQGSLTGTANPATLPMTSDCVVRAYFYPSRELTLLSTPTDGGTATGAGAYRYGSYATLSATPNPGYEFWGWSPVGGGRPSYTNPMRIRMTENVTYSAVFHSMYSLATRAAPEEGGTVVGGGTYREGSRATLTATAAPGYRFTGWEGDAAGTRNPLYIHVVSDLSVTARFVADGKYVVETDELPAEGGRVTGAGTYAEGSLVTLEAIPDPGFTFVCWDGTLLEIPTSGNPLQWVASGDASLIAFFTASDPAADHCILNASLYPLDTAGSVMGAGAYAVGESATLTATASEGYRFAGWSGDIQSYANPLSILMETDCEVYAHFVWDVYVISGRAKSGGSVFGSGQYTAGAEATLTAIPAEGYQFDHWEGAFSGSDNPATVPVDSNKIVYAHFVRTFTLRAIPNNAYYGTIEGGGVYVEGTTATLSATPQPGYAFVGWQGSLTGTANPATLPMTSDCVVRAYFYPSRELTLLSTPTDGGTATGAGAYRYGSYATLSATPNPGYEFWGWSPVGGGRPSYTNPMRIRMTENVTYSAVFHSMYSLATRAAPEEGGTVVGGGTYRAGSRATLTATAAPGYEFSHWQGAVTGYRNPVAVLLRQDCEVVAVFVKTTADLTP